jgi:hypothetical protein
MHNVEQYQKSEQNPYSLYEQLINETNALEAFRAFRAQTEITHIEIDGLKFRVATLNFSDFVYWVLQEQELQKELDSVEIDVEFSDFEYLN